MKLAPGDFLIQLRPHAGDRRDITRRLRFAYKALARLGLRVIDHRERGERGWIVPKVEKCRGAKGGCAACTAAEQ